MTPERWAQVDQLLAAALERPESERAAFLAEACGGDEALRAEVESLLLAHAEAEAEFLSTPALEAAVRDLAHEQRDSLAGDSLVGTTFGRYRVLSVLGVGGMGEVYLAQDTRLNRKVALKLLPAEFTQDAARIKRFEREARAASALNHPNIITIYEIGQEDGKHFIAAEYVDGKTLRALLANGQMPLKEVAEIAMQTAAALATAHAAGIIHRDIKPENVMLRRDGYVKVLDFGLAKLTEQSRSAAQTHGSGDLARTNPGALLGTVRYMSPEQALGQELDQRSDIFSLGVLLYELIAGVPPFKGISAAATLDAIVHHHPLPIASLRAAVSPELERILDRCLEKDRTLRYQTADDLRADLKRCLREIDFSSTHSAAPHHVALAKPSVGKVRGAVWLTLVALVCVAGAATWWRWTRQPAEKSPAWSRAAATQLTGFAGAELFPAFSPDSKEFVYARSEKGNWDIFQQRLSQGAPRNLTEDSLDDDTQPAYSPDGEWIAFRSERQDGGIFVMGARGGQVRKIADQGYYPDWSPDGQEIIFSSAQVTDPFLRGSNVKLYGVQVASGRLREIDAGLDAVQPRWSPRGLRIAFWGKDAAAQRDIWTVSARGGDPVRVTNDAAVDWNPAWAPDGQFIYFISNRKGAPSLWRVPVDEASGRATGEPEPIIGPLAQSWQLTLARDGRHLVFVERQVRDDLYAIAFDPVKYETIGQAAPVLEGSKRSNSPDVSPDGQWLAYYTRGETNEDIYAIKTDGTSPMQLTHDAFNDRLPRWSRDGQQIIYYSNASGKYELWAIKRDGSGRRQISFNQQQPHRDHQGSDLVYPVPSPDGRWIAYCVASTGATFLLDAHKPWHEQQPQALPFIKPNDEWFIAWSWSPDGQKLAGWSETRRGGSAGSYIYSLQTQRFEKLAAGGVRQYWLSDNRHLLCVDNDQLYLLDSLKKTKRLLVTLPQQSIRSASLSADLRRLYLSVLTDEANLRLLTLE
jgi:eukaryotic-like serine/threonine-protein kinase